MPFAPRWAVRELTEAEADAAAALFREIEPELVTTPAALLHDQHSAPAAMASKHWVATDEQELVGVAKAYLRWWSSEGEIGQIHLGVSPNRRRQAIGSMLLATAEEHLGAQGAKRLRLRARRGSVGVRFAAARGYSEPVVSEMLWSLDPREAPLDELAKLERQAAADGFRLSPLREVREPARELFQFYGVAGGIPAGAPVTFDEWQATILENPVLDLDGSAVVLRAQQPVALAWLLVDRASGQAENEWTATLPELRGRGLARLAKLATIRWAAANGIREITTENDIDNAPMLALNRRLGYREVAIRDDFERSGNAFPASAGSTCAVTQTGVVTYRAE